LVNRRERGGGGKGDWGVMEKGKKGNDEGRGVEAGGKNKRGRGEGGPSGQKERVG